MPYANNSGIRIHYEVEGHGPALLLAHGFSLSGEDWRELGYVDQLSDRYRVIMVDGRGHGLSDRPHDPLAYSAAGRVKDHFAVLDDLGIDRAHFWGYSAGGVVGLSTAVHAPDRIFSIIIGSLDPYPDSHDIGDRTPLTQKAMHGVPPVDDPVRALLDEGNEAWLQFLNSNMEVPAGMAERVRKNDCQALIAQWEQPDPWRDKVLPLIPDFPFPCLLYVGDAEPSYKGMQVCAEEMPRAQFIALANFGHLDIFANPASIIPYVINFLDMNFIPDN